MSIKTVFLLPQFTAPKKNSQTMAQVSFSNCFTILWTTVLVLVSILAAGPIFTCQMDMSSPTMVNLTQEAKDYVLGEVERSAELYGKDTQMVTYNRVQDPYLFVTVCFLIPPPDEGFVENKKIMLHLLGRLVPQNRYAFMNMSTTRDSTPAVGGGYCNGTVWEHDAYREKCTYCTNFLLTDVSMFPQCNYTIGIGVGFDLAAIEDHPVNCELSFSTAY